MKIDITGHTFNRLTAIRECGKTKSGNIKWLFDCSCGNQLVTTAVDVRKGHTKSCGCFKREGNNLKHGQGKKGKQTAEYKAWAGMIKRCTDEKCVNYSDYGGRGVTVCNRWLISFENFYEDMGKKPSANHSLDRFPNNETGIYEKSNCRWATLKQQSENKRSNKRITHNGETLLLRDWIKKLKINSGNFYQRKKKGYTHLELIQYYDKRVV